MTNVPNRWTKAIFFLLLFLCIITSGAILKILSSFLMPVILAVLLAFIFFPIVKKLNRSFKIPWILSVIIVYVLFFVVFVAIANILVTSIKSIIDSFPQYEARFISIYEKISETFSESRNSSFLQFFNLNNEQSLFENLQNQLNLTPAIKSLALGFTGFIYKFLKNLLMVILFSIFLLSEMHFTKTKIELSFKDKYRSRVNNVIHNIISEVTNYISIKFVISLITGTLVSVICCIIRMDFPLVWGFLAFILNFIPTFGSIISWAATTLFALIQFFPAPAPIIFCAITVIAVNMILGNVVEPKIEGKNLGLSPFIILVNLSLWGWLWGFMGLLLAVPLMVIVKIVCENISFLHPIAIFLGNRPSDTKRELSPELDADDGEEQTEAEVSR